MVSSTLCLLLKGVFYHSIHRSALRAARKRTVEERISHKPTSFPIQIIDTAMKYGDSLAQKSQKTQGVCDFCSLQYLIAEEIDVK